MTAPKTPTLREAAERAAAILGVEMRRPGCMHQTEEVYTALRAALEAEREREAAARECADALAGLIEEWERHELDERIGYCERARAALARYRGASR